MKNAIICGAGKMGKAIGFAMRRLGYNISIVENNQDNIQNFFDCNGECTAYGHWSQISSHADIFISALPYHATLDAAVWCIDNGVRYCDLGGSVPVSHQIREVAERDGKAPVMTDLGLAPGWVNIAAEEMYQLMPDADTITMMVGGIPPAPHADDPLKYKVTWSMDGLLNEYVDGCMVLDNGYHQKMAGMSDLENVTIDNLELECFNTSGALAHTMEVMEKRGVRNVSYKTLRWRGHCKMMTYLIRAFGVGSEESGHNRKAIEDLLYHSSKYYDRDMVILYVTVSKSHGVGHPPHRTLNKSLRIHTKNNFSAMQRATAFPISAVAHQMAQGRFDALKYPVYSDIDIKPFNADLDKLLNG